MAGLSNHYCTGCEQDTLHRGLECIHCDTKAEGIDMTPLKLSVRAGVSNLFSGTPAERRKARDENMSPLRVGIGK